MASQPQTRHSTTRVATPADLDAIVTVAIAALPADPVNPYRYPRWQEFPEDYAHFTRLRYAGWLADPNNVIMVSEVPSSDLGNPPQGRDDTGIEKALVVGDRRLVAFSIWELPPSQRTAEPASNDTAVPVSGDASERRPASAATHPEPAGPLPVRRDASPARVVKYAEEFAKAKDCFFAQPYAESNLYLSILACHPSYQRRGIGKQLVSWGLNKAKSEGLDVTVFGSPMGSLLYRNVGFREVGKFRVQVDGEEEYLDTLAMVLENKDIR